LKGLLDEVEGLRARINELEERELDPLPLAGEGGARKRAV
jgi:hypothetical protein